MIRSVGVALGRLRAMASAPPDLFADAAQVIPEGELRARLDAGRPLRVKLGIDPSRPDLHLGHAVVLRKLRQFQDLGHTAVLIVGDFTGRVGDPTGRSETRPFLTEQEIEANAQTYFEQAGVILDIEHAEVRRNSEWLGTMSMADLLRLTATTTVAQMLERDDFQARYREGRAISVVEFLYPLMQAVDSVQVQADVELGGKDQMFNLLMGREVQRAYGQEPQVVFTMPLLIGADGRRMSKSFDNYIGLTEAPEETFGKLMRIPDELIGDYLRHVAGSPPGEADRGVGWVRAGSLHPGEEKGAMARAVVARYHGEDAARRAEERFDTVHVEREIPEDVPEVRLKIPVSGEFVDIPDLLVQIRFATSKSEARRLLLQRGVRLNGQILPENPEVTVEAINGSTLQIGRRKFAKVLDHDDY